MQASSASHFNCFCNGLSSGLWNPIPGGNQPCLSENRQRFLLLRQSEAANCNLLLHTYCSCSCSKATILLVLLRGLNFFSYTVKSNKTRRPDWKKKTQSATQKTWLIHCSTHHNRILVHFLILRHLFINYKQVSSHCKSLTITAINI